jgi:ABC-type tungstate transport system permease subunit
MAKLYELLAGDTVKLGDETATFIARSRHPKFHNLELVIWKLHRDNSWSLDALRWYQEIGEVITSSPESKWREVRKAFGEDDA